MEIIRSLITEFSVLTIFITPLTLVMGLIYAIKKPENEAMPYKIIAKVSAYLILIPILYLLYSR